MLLAAAVVVDAVWDGRMAWVRNGAGWDGRGKHEAIA